MPEKRGRKTGSKFPTTRKQREAIRAASLRQERELLDRMRSLTQEELRAELERAKDAAQANPGGPTTLQRRVNDIEFELRVRAGDINAVGGRNLRDMRIRRGMTHEDLARAIHGNRHSIRRMEQGEYKSFDIETLKAMSDALSTSIDFLFFKRKSTPKEKRRRTDDNAE